MILFFRLIIIITYAFLVCFFGIIYCLIRPRHPSNVFIFTYLFSYILKILGLKIETRKSKTSSLCNHAIYICNHQSYYDMLTVSNIMKPNTVTIGKKNLLWVPFFGLLYWLSGNFTIDRKNFKKAHNTITKILKITKKKKFLFGYFQKEKEV